MRIRSRLLILGLLLILLNLMNLSPSLATKTGEKELAGVSYLIFSPFCHQISSRSFHLFGVQLAVCARCTGIYLGLLLGIIFFIIFSPKISQLALVPILVMAGDGLVNWLGLVSSPSWLRFIFGLGFGFVGGWLLGIGSDQLGAFKEKKWQTRSIS